MHLNNEIHEQTAVIARLITDGRANIAHIAQKIRDFNPTFVVIAARGTSDNAARYAQYLFGAKAGLSVGLSAPSLHTLYETPPNMARALVIGISQSGQAEDVRRVITDANTQGALTVSITNDDNSPLAHEAQYHISLMAGEEISIAATKTYTAQLTAIASLVTELTANTEMRATLDALPSAVATTLEYASTVSDWAERYRYMSQFITIGRGYNYATAYEISLKVKELCYITGEGYSEADFRHGPIALIHNGVPVIAVAPHGKTLANVVDLMDKLRQREAELLVISNNDQALAYGVKQMRLPDVPEWVSPIIAVIPGQVFAMNQALVRGYAVDKPRGLSKVTVTQ
jgi:glucosamine--fructose-6-phosphate aminotransferase (isomerizing)